VPPWARIKRTARSSRPGAAHHNSASTLRGARQRERMKHCIAALVLLASLGVPDGFQSKVSGHGRAMILIPGLSSSGETWDSTVDHFKDRFECHVLTVAGFAGVPRVPGPMLDRVVDDLAAYIRDRRLARPVIVGHSLGGFLALRFAIKYPDLPGAIVDVDGYTNYLRLTGSPAISREQAKATAEQIRQGIGHMTPAAYEAYVRSGVATRMMVSRDADFEVLVRWGLASDPAAVADALAEMYEADLRADLAKITAPTLVLAYHAYAVKAFEVNALDYLMKPVAPERLAAALARLGPPARRELLEQVFVRDGDRCWIVRLPEIFLFQSEGNYTRVHFRAEQPLVRRSLNALEQRLDPDAFFRANRAQIFNLKWIESVDEAVSGGLIVTLRGGRIVEMSRRRSDRLREILSL
jgi:DNA-binding LytR/AlgR family response regulator